MTTPRPPFRLVSRAPAGEPDDEGRLPAVVVLEPTMTAAAAVVDDWAPTLTVQVLGGAGQPDQSLRATVGYGVALLGLRTVIVCGQGSGPPDREGAGDQLLRGCRRLLGDAELSLLLRGGPVAVEALWFDTAERTISRYLADERRFERLSRVALVRFLATVVERSRARHPALVG